MFPLAPADQVRTDRLTRRFGALAIRPTRRRPVALRRDLNTRNSLAEAFDCSFPRLSMVRFEALNRSKRVAALCRCLEWPQTVSGLLTSAATLINRPGAEGASRCCRQGEQLEVCSTRTLSRRGGVATDRHWR